MGRYRLLLIAGLLCSCVAGTKAASGTQALIDQANQAWQERDKPGQTEDAIRLWEEALKQDPQQADLYIFLTRACGRAYRHSVTAAERQQWADLGRHYGSLSIAKNPRDAEAYSQYGAALGQWAQARKGIHSLGAVRKAMSALQQAVTIDPHNAFAHMLLSSFYRHAPGWPISVGDKKKALEEALLAVTYGNGVAINHLVLARSYLSFGRKQEARQELQKILTLTPPSDAVPETRADQDTAREMLKDL
jgi:tetratricopeptide (TPR) repeat protein